MSEECANPLLLGWIKEWLDQARERNSKGVTVFVPSPYLSPLYVSDTITAIRKLMSR